MPMAQDTNTPLSAASLGSLLFARAAAEDLARYSPETLGSIASEAYSFLSRPRRIGSPAVRVFNPDDAALPQLADLTIIEAVNDDMPFLLDSTLAELVRCETPAILIPYPFAANNHQQANAQHFEQQGGGVVIAETALATLRQEVADVLFNDSLINKFRDNLCRMSEENTIETMVQDLEALARQDHSVAASKPSAPYQPAA